MKDFICVSCWTSFQVDEATVATSASVACPKCATQQPTGQDASGGGARMNDLPDEAAATLEMSLPASLIAELSKGNSPFAFPGDDPAGSTDPDGGSTLKMKFSPELGRLVQDGPIGASLDDLLPPTRPPAPPGPPIPPPIAAAPAPAPAAAPAGDEADGDDDEEAQWRMKMRSGLVLSFPTIDMVTAWASEKPADQMSISYGELPFQPYVAFLEVFGMIADPVEALKAAGQPRPKTNPGQAAPVVAHTSDPGNASGEVAAAARAAAAAARSAAGERQRLPTEFRFRTGKGPSPWPKRLAILFVLMLLVGGGVVGVLWWQGILDLPFLDALL